MESHNFISITSKATAYLMFLTLVTILSSTSARILDEQPVPPPVPPQPSDPVSTPDAHLPTVAATTSATDAAHTLTFFMHDILGGSNPSALAVAGVVNNPAVIDNELTEGHELGSGFVGKAQGFYVASSIDGSSQTMAFTTMFQSGNFVDSLSFFGVHRTATFESQLAIMGGTGKYVNAKGLAIVKTLRETNQHETDGVETLLEFTVYVSY